MRGDGTNDYVVSLVLSKFLGMSVDWLSCFPLLYLVQPFVVYVSRNPYLVSKVIIKLSKCYFQVISKKYVWCSVYLTLVAALALNMRWLSESPVFYIKDGVIPDNS